MGHMVTEINGISGNSTAGTYWAFVRFYSEEKPKMGECVMSVGVSSYVPKDGDHLGFRLVPSDYWKKAPGCDKDANHA